MIKNRIELAEYFRHEGFTRGAEIGVADGRYSEVLCRKIQGLELICVDPFYRKGHEEDARSRLKPFGSRIIKKKSIDASFDVPDKSLDFVFIDADHRFNYVMEDIILWTRKVRSGGIVAGHDYYHFTDSGVVEAINKYTEENKIELNIIPRSDEGHKDDRAPCWWFRK